MPMCDSRNLPGSLPKSLQSSSTHACAPATRAGGDGTAVQGYGLRCAYQMLAKGQEHLAADRALRTAAVVLRAPVATRLHAQPVAEVLTREQGFGR